MTDAYEDFKNNQTDPWDREDSTPEEKMDYIFERAYGTEHLKKHFVMSIFCEDDPRDEPTIIPIGYGNIEAHRARSEDEIDDVEIAYTLNEMMCAFSCHKVYNYGDPDNDLGGHTIH